MLTIHVGLAKTGSSSIQESLRSLPAVSRPSLVYLGDDILCSTNGFQVPRGLSKNRSQTLRVLATNRDVVLSSEHYLSSAWIMYRNAVESALEMRSLFADHADFRVVIYLRPQLQYFESLYVQWSKAGRQGGGRRDHQPAVGFKILPLVATD